VFGGDRARVGVFDGDVVFSEILRELERLLAMLCLVGMMHSLGDRAIIGSLSATFWRSPWRVMPHPFHT
jgi:hypothetical protein